MGATNRRPSSEIWTDFSHGNEVACLCDKTFASGASSTVLKARFRTDLWSQDVLLTRWYVFSTNQKHYQYPHVISMEFLYSFHRRHFAAKPVVASRNVVCLLRLVFEVLTIFFTIPFTSRLESNKAYGKVEIWFRLLCTSVNDGLSKRSPKLECKSDLAINLWLHSKFSRV